ncbi:hypothetical protein [Reticulibacter mediterranei]|uniref:hypothetical protein n=1 Tax=Reticulibacter mediterranei TaxID=2778369 RepID=UPI001C68C950|nr:hypothetical protein [Reticulibacter mediterranei]
MKKPVSRLPWDQRRHFRLLMNDAKALDLTDHGPFCRPGDFPRRCGGQAGVPNGGSNLLIPRRTRWGKGRCRFSHERSWGATK